MAKYKVEPAQPDGGVGTYFQFAELTRHGATKATYVDPDNGYVLVITGKDLFYDGEQIVGGTITGMTQKDQNGGIWYTISGGKLDGADFPDVSEAYLPYYTSIALRSGNDLLLGSGGEDSLVGYGGKDRLYGKGGNDVLVVDDGVDTLTGGRGDDDFQIVPNRGRDIITDFKAHGDADQLVMINTGDYELKNTKHGLLMTTDAGASVLLEGVRERDIEPDDITAWV